jgi:DNA topoisomerase-2
MRTRNVTDFLNNELKEYAIDVIENRAIPSVIDGLKPTSRKVIYVANKIWKTGNEKPMKVFQLSGQMAADAYYHHGDQSANAVITVMGQTFKNSLPLLEGIGQYGSLRSTCAGAPRYISTRLSPNFRNLYKDFELLESRYDEGQEVEPIYFLPILPTIILNGTSGIAVGFASNILNRNPKDVLNACVDVLNGKKMKELKPWFLEFSGTYTRDKDNKNKWVITGKYEVNKNDVHITELPPSWTFEKYESYLDTLVDKKIIKDYDNNSSAGVDYTLKFKKDDLHELIEKGKLDDILKINESSTENLTTLDEYGKLKIFDCVEDIVEYFVNFRLGYYQKRKDYMIDKHKKELNELTNKAKFIKNIIDKKLNVNGVKKDVIVSWLDEHDFDRIDDSYNYLLTMPIYSLTKERYEELLKKIGDKKEQIDDISKEDPKQMYLDDLNELKKKLK